MDRSKASKLSDKIHNAVDEYLLSRDLPDLKASVNRKRPQHDGIDPDTLDGVPMIKKSKPETEETGNGNGAAAPAVPMTPAQIRAMMANTMKQIEDRKASIAAMQGKAGNEFWILFLHKIKQFLNYRCFKVNSVQEACTKCLAVHILRFEILPIT